MTTTVPDRIEKQVMLKAPLARVWRAIADTREFGRWFGVTFDGPFVVGQTLSGRIVPTMVDVAIAETQKPYEGLTFDVTVEQIEPEKRLSFRWHPGDPKADYTNDPTTLVEFHLEPLGDHVRLTIIESGFDRIPLARRAEAFRMNEQGWAEQTKLIQAYLAHTS